jgi:hypothetical protein
MTARTRLLALLSLPAGALGYVLTSALIGQLGAPDALEGVLQLFLPLLVAGLCMAPFLLPFFDAMAKRDLAALRESREEPTGEDGSAEEPPDA